MADTAETAEPAGAAGATGTAGAAWLREPAGAVEPREAGEAGEAGEAAGASGDSMFRNAYALMLSTGVSAALGLGFWLVAARYYTEDAVGQGSAAIAAMRLLASITATTMIGAVVRYVPRAGRATGSLVWRAYAISSVVVCVACVVFLLTLGLWGPSYAPLGGLTAGVVFTASSIGWAVLTLQDGVLTGLRKAVWVPVGNAVFSLGKLLLLAAFATAMPVLGVFVSWAAAIALSVVPLGWLVFRRLIPRQAAADRDREPLRPRDIGRFLAGDSVGSLFSLAMINLLPVIVAVRFDSAHNAFFYTAYTVGGTMEFMAVNMASSLTAHASHSPERLAEGVRGALRRMAVLLVPVVLVLVVFAPLVLAPFGGDYAAHGTTVLRLLAAATLPRVIVELYIGVLRVQGRTGMLAVLQGSMCALVLGSTVLLLGPAGISGAGISMVLSMTLIALFAAPGLRAALSGRPPHGEVRRGEARRARGEARTGTRTRARTRTRTRTAVPASAVRPYGTAWAERAAEDPASPGDDVPESWAVTLLWLLFGLGAGLFWVPLLRTGPTIGRPTLTGGELLDALPPLTLAAGILLVVVQCAAASLVRPRPALPYLTLLVTFAALHSAAPLLGVPVPLAPVAVQLLCLVLVALTLGAGLRTDGRVTVGVLWLLMVAGWAAQHAFATAGPAVLVGLPVGLCAVCGAVFGVRRRRAKPERGPERRLEGGPERRPTDPYHRDGTGWLK